MAKFLIHKPGFIKTVGNSVPAHYPAGSIIEVSADTPAAQDWEYIPGSGDHTPWQAPAAVPWAQTGLAHDLAAFDARK